MQKQNKFDLLERIEAQAMNEAGVTIKKTVFCVEWLQRRRTSELRTLHGIAMKRHGLDAETLEELDFIEKNRANIRRIVWARKETIEEKWL